MFTYKKYELLAVSNKPTAYQLLNYPTIMRYVAIQKFGVGILERATLIVNKLLIAHNILSIYEMDRNKDSSGKTTSSSMRHIPPPPMMTR